MYMNPDIAKEKGLPWVKSVIRKFTCQKLGIYDFIEGWRESRKYVRKIRINDINRMDILKREYISNITETKDYIRISFSYQRLNRTYVGGWDHKYDGDHWTTKENTFDVLFDDYNKALREFKLKQLTQ